MQKNKYFNEGNDCDLCKHKIMTGRDGDIEDCELREQGMSCRFEERDIRVCSVCNNEVDRKDMNFTRNCHGITSRLVCNRCYKKLMAKGYDGDTPTNGDEQIEDNY